MRNVLINGGSRGIGAAMVRAFCGAGDRVTFTYCHAQAQAQALAAHTGALALQADSGSLREVQAAVAECRQKNGEIAILINNAAVSEVGLFPDMQEERWQRMLAVNLNGPVWFCREVLPGMIREKRGCILNVSSMWGVVGASCEVGYSTTKAALLGLTKALAKEVGPCGITVNAIAPGVIDTDMNAALSAEDLAALKEETPLGRLGTPEEVAQLALFLCGEGGAFITGQVIGQNGGFSVS